MKNNVQPKYNNRCAIARSLVSSLKNALQSRSFCFQAA